MLTYVLSASPLFKFVDVRTVKRYNRLKEEQDEMHDEELLTVDDAAKKVKVHPETIRGWIRSGELPAVDIGGKYRIYPEDLDAFLKRRKTTRGKESN